MYFKQIFISALVAEKLSNVLQSVGCPTENRVLIFSPKDQEIKQGGIIIPGQVKEGVPRKGVVILSGFIDEQYASYKPLVQTGRILTYGMYAGKELDFDPDLLKEAGIEIDLDHNQFTVLSINEIIYSEINK